MRNVVLAGLALGLVAMPAHAQVSNYVSSGVNQVGDTAGSNAGPDYTPFVSVATNVNGLTAWASANTDSGALKGGFNALGMYGTRAAFDAAFTEAFTFSAPGAGEDQVTNLGLRIRFDGTVEGGVSRILLTTDVTTSSTGLTRNSILLTDFGAPYFTGGAYTTLASGAIRGTMEVVMPFSIRGSSDVVRLFADAYGTIMVDGLARADFGNSAHYSFLLPDDGSVTFVGQSATSFTQPESLGGVPEPASWALMLAGFGALGAALRTRRFDLARARRA